MERRISAAQNSYVFAQQLYIPSFFKSRAVSSNCFASANIFSIAESLTPAS